MPRWEFRSGLILLVWGPVEAALELGTSSGTVMALEEGAIDERLDGEVVERARMAFEARGLAIQPSDG